MAAIANGMEDSLDRRFAQGASYVVRMVYCTIAQIA
jgi:hypothetical protein